MSPAAAKPEGQAPKRSTRRAAGARKGAVAATAPKDGATRRRDGAEISRARSQEAAPVRSGGTTATSLRRGAVARPGAVAQRGGGVVRHITLHGHRVAYRAAGDSGPVVVLVHGITSNSATWEPVMPLLSAGHQVVAPDLFGHGQSAKPRGDYSLGAYASGVRDLLVALGHERATVVGHSLGGGVAMQLSYQYPDLVERLVLVGSGGLGREVNVLLRAASLPGAELVLPLLTKPGLLDAGMAMGRLLGRLGLKVNVDVREVAQGHASLADAEARQAFLSTLRAIVDLRGQRVDARDRLYLASALPSLLVWGERDPIIPARHGRDAHALIPGSRLEVFERMGHYPHMEDPHRFAALLAEFIANTEAADVDMEHWRRLLREGENGAHPPQRRSSTEPLDS